MKRRSLGAARRIGIRPLEAIAALALTIAVAGCSAHAKQAALQPAASPTPNQAADSAPPPGPEAKIQISYSQPNDFLSAILLTKYSGADVLQKLPADSHGEASVVRFEGGAPMWQINVEPGMFSEMPLGFSAKTYAIGEVKYGKVPPHFVQTIPDLGPPEPLEANRYYIFSVTRKSGSVSYEAVKVNADGSLQAYEAEPRASTSFRLCCKLASDFSVIAPPAVSDTSSPPADMSGPAGSSGPADTSGPGDTSRPAGTPGP
jgi:hypothetical protein